MQAVPDECTILLNVALIMYIIQTAVEFYLAQHTCSVTK